MEKPCRYCTEYPYWCKGLCREMMKYINLTDRETVTVGRMPKLTYHSDPHYGKIKIVTYELNKNGIRREVIKWR